MEWLELGLSLFSDTLAAIVELQPFAVIISYCILICLFALFFMLFRGVRSR